MMKLHLSFFESIIQLLIFNNAVCFTRHKWSTKMFYADDTKMSNANWASKHTYDHSYLNHA